MIERLMARAAALEAEMRGYMVDGQVGPEHRDAWIAADAQLREVEDQLGAAKDAEIEELRSRLDTAEAGPRSDDDGEFRSWMRSGKVGPGMEELRAMEAGTDASGGFLVPENIHAPLVELMRDVNPILGAATLFELTGGSTSIELPRKATHGVVANATEKAARTEQDAPTIANATLTCHDYYTDQRATQLYLDSVSGAEGQLTNWIYEDIWTQAEADAVTGTGAKINGLFAGGYGTVDTAAAGAISNEDVFKLYFSLPAAYRRSALFVANSDTLSALAQLKHPATDSRPLVENVGDSWTVFGREVVETDAVASVAAGAVPLAFGNIAKAYAVGIHRRPTILRDPYTATPYIRFYGLARLGGCAWDLQACKLLKVKTA